VVKIVSYKSDNGTLSEQRGARNASVAIILGALLFSACMWLLSFALSILTSQATALVKSAQCQNNVQ